MVKRIDCEPGLDDRTTVTLAAGDAVSVSGELLTIRDATAKRLFDLATAGHELPVDLAGRLLYAVGPSPAKPGQVVGSAGPTTTERFVNVLQGLNAPRSQRSTSPSRGSRSRRRGSSR